MHNYYNNYIIL